MLEKRVWKGKEGKKKAKEKGEEENQEQGKRMQITKKTAKMMKMRTVRAK